jgi:hypothetical protein
VKALRYELAIFVAGLMLGAAISTVAVIGWASVALAEQEMRR